jgi:hypothetical protein
MNKAEFRGLIARYEPKDLDKYQIVIFLNLIIYP